MKSILTKAQMLVVVAIAISVVLCAGSAQAQQYTVTASAGANGTVDPNGDIIVNSGEDLLFTATAKPGYTVSSWYVDSVKVQTGGNTYTLTNITANHRLLVTFKPLQFTVTGSAGANGTIAPNGAITVNGGSNQLFTATANPGYMVDTWYLDGNSVQSGGGTYTLVNITANHTVLVTFKLLQYTVTGSAGANGTIDPNGAIIVDPCQDQLFTATANTGYEVDTWSVDGGIVQAGGTTYTLTNIQANHTVLVTFKLLQYTVTASAGANGSIAPSGAIVVNYGADRLFTATANLGYAVDTWSVDGSSVQTGGTTYTLTNITADHTVLVTFESPQRTVTASADANGTIDPNGAIVVNYGADQMFTATANIGYMVDSWYLDGNSVQVGGDTYTLVNITADHTVHVTFKINLFDLRQILTFNITMDPGDWDMLVADCPGGQCIPDANCEHQYWQATLTCGDLGPMLVAIRRKNGFAEPNETNPQKVSLKIDVNRYSPGQLFAGKKKLSLENGGDMALVAEGLSWNIYQRASNYFVSGRSAWCKVYVNGDYKGLYSNVEQIDKIYLLDHIGDHDGFLYEHHEYCGEVQRTREVETSPFRFNWYPFDHPADIAETIPPPGDWLEQAQWRVNIPAVLALAAAGNFIANTDAAIMKGTNFSYYDLSTDPNSNDPNFQLPRWYFPWDLDTTIRNSGTYMDILNPAGADGAGHIWWGLIREIDESGTPFGYPTHQADYLETYNTLLNGPFDLASLISMVNDIELTIGAEVDADPYTQLGVTAAEEFSRIRTFLTNRYNYVTARLAELAPLPGTFLLDDGFEGTVWDANWNDTAHTWTRGTDLRHSGSAAAKKVANTSGTFTSDNLDASDANAIYIRFWYNLDDTEDTDLRLYYYNGSTYVEMPTIGGGAEDTWLCYTATVTDPQYFVSNFRIRFNATLGNGENVWVDDVVITKEIPTVAPCDAANLDGIGLVDFKDYALFAPDWQQTGGGLTGDITGDEVVDFKDLDWLVEYWLNDCSQP